jgi:spore germination protein YaaH
MSTEHRKYMSWTFTKTDRMYDQLDQYGDRIYQLGCFDFTVNSSGVISGSVPDRLLPIIQKWPHIRWFLTVRNDGIESVFRALVLNTGGAQDKFISEIHRILDTYPWAAGIDLDLERGPDELRNQVTELYKRIYQSVKTRPGQNLVHTDLPPKQGDHTPYWEESFDYAALASCFDSCTIMSYGFAWSGSGPGPISPLSWIEEIYNYAVTVIPKEKIFLGMPAYGYRWQIYAKPGDLGQTYRGISLTYPGAQYWLLGNFNHTGDGPPQALIPFAGFWDEENQCPWALLHVYDYLEGHDCTEIDYPLQKGSWGGKNFVTCYSKEEQYWFGNIFVDRSALSYDEISGAMGISYDGYIYPKPSNYISQPDGTYEREPEGYAKYILGEWDTGWLVVEVNFPWFDRNWLVIKVDGEWYDIGPDYIVPPRYGAQGSRAQWYPLNRKRHWRYVCKIDYTGEPHTIEVMGAWSRYYTQFWGFRILGQYIEPYGLVQEFTAGNAKYQANLSKFRDKNGAEVYPDNFKLSLEALRRIPESALVWHEDWRDFTYIPYGYYYYWGSWQVMTDPNDKSERPYRWLRGNGNLYLDYGSFLNLHIKGRFRFLEGETGRAGVVFYSNSGEELWACLNHTDQKIELWQGDTLLASTDQTVIPTWQYTVELRCRGAEAKVWVTGEVKLTASITADQYGTPGIKQDCAADNDLFRVGDAYWYQPQEAIKAYFGGQWHTLGRIPRTGVVWDDYWGYFYLESGEESNTRTESISSEWDYLHSAAVEAAEGSHNVPVYPLDSGVWLSNIFAGDADGFSIMYYSDINNMFHLMNMAKHGWQLKGYGVWALGMEDHRIWGYLPEEKI